MHTSATQWAEANLILSLKSEIFPPSGFNTKGLKMLKMNIWTINFMLRQPTTKRVLWEIYRGASSTNLHPIFNKTTKKPHHNSLKIYLKELSFGVSAQQEIQFSRKQPRSLWQPLSTQHLFHVAENIKIFVFALPENSRF